MRVYVVGLGSAGRRHLANARALGHDVGGGRLDGAEDFHPDCIVVASPTSAHTEGLRWAVEHGVHAYVEKPISTTSDGVADLLDAAERAGLTIAVGYNLRFHPALESIRAAIAAGRIGRLLSVRAEVGQHLSDWQPGRDYRDSSTARAELGGGALLTLSHELDYVRWIAGEVEEVQGVALRVSSLAIDVDDVAEVVSVHENGVVSSVHADFLDRAYNRRSRWVGEAGTIVWGLQEDARVLPENEAIWETGSGDLDGTYPAALADFFTAIQTGGMPRCAGQDGLRTLELCERVLRREDA